MDYQKVVSHLINGNISPIYLLQGDELFLQQEFLRHLHHQLGDFEQIDWVQFDLQEDSISQVLDEADSFSFFADYRLIYCKNTELFSQSNPQKLSKEEQDRLAKYLENPNQATILIFFLDNHSIDKRKKISKIAMNLDYIVDVTTLNEAATQKFVQEHLHTLKLNMDQSAMDEFLVRVNFNLSKAMNEMAKLELFGRGNRLIDRTVIQGLVPRTLESDVFQLTNAITSKRFQDAVQIYEDLLVMGNEPIALHALIISQFRIMLQALILSQEGLREGEIAKVLGVHPYRVKLALQAVRSMHIQKMQKFYIKLAEVDYQLKTGIGQAETHFYVLLTQLNNI